MSNSSLITYTKRTKKYGFREGHPIDTISVHCTAGSKLASVKSVADYFYNLDRDASCNYVVGIDGVALVVDEANRSWCSSNKENDARAITIEVCSDNKAPYEVDPRSIQNLIALLVDVCKRNNIPKLLWCGDKNLIGQIDKQNMTVHRWFAKKACPGEYLYNLHPYIVSEVNKLLNTEVSEKMAKTNNVNVSELTPIRGKSVIPADVFRKVFTDRGASEYLDIIDTYFEAEEHYGIRADIALCQSMLETNNFRFTGRVPASANNFGGLGAIDSDKTAYAIFPNHFIGAVAEMQHLCAYALKEDVTKLYAGWVLVDPRYNLVQRGCAEYVEHLGQKENPKGKGWASAKNYGYNIMKWYKEIYDKYMKIESEPVHIDIPDVLKDSDNIEDLSKRRDTPDYVVQIVPTKVNVFDQPNGKVIKTMARSRQIIIEEQDGFGLLSNKEGWLQLAFCTYVEDVPEQTKIENSEINSQTSTSEESAE